MRKLSTLLILLIIVITASAVYANAVAVEVNGHPLNFSVDPMILEDRTLVPLRAIFEVFGLEVGWDNATRSVTGKNDKYDISFVVGEHTAQVNGKTVNLEVPAIIVDGHTLAPLRFVSETVGATIGWNAKSQIVYIDSPTNEENDATYVTKEIYEQRNEKFEFNLTIVEDGFIFKHPQDAHIYHYNIEAKSYTKLVDEEVFQMSRVGDIIYYTMGYCDVYSYSLITKVKKKLPIEINFIDSAGTNIFYMWHDLNRRDTAMELIRWNPVTKKQDTLLTEIHSNSRLYGNHIYYTNYVGNQHYRVDLNGENKIAIGDENISDLFYLPYDGHLYYESIADNERRVYKADLDGSNPVFFTDRAMRSSNFKDGWIYHLDRDTISLHKMDMNGENITKIDDRYLHSFALVDDKILSYYGDEVGNHVILMDQYGIELDRLEPLK